jgi:hypothetical protein
VAKKVFEFKPNEAQRSPMKPNSILAPNQKKLHFKIYSQVKSSQVELANRLFALSAVQQKG